MDKQTLGSCSVDIYENSNPQLASYSTSDGSKTIIIAHNQNSTSSNTEYYYSIYDNLSKTHTPSKYISRTDYQNLIEGNCSIEITSDTIFGITYENNGIKIENNNGTIINTNNEINGNPNQWLVVGGVVVGLATVGAVIWFSKGKIVPAQQIGSATGEIIGGETAKQLIGQYLDKMAAFLITTIASMQDVEAKTFEIVDNNIWATITNRFKTTIQTIKSANAWLDNPQTSNENFTLIENTQQLYIPENVLRGSVSYDESFETARDIYTGEKSPSDLINYEIPEDSEFYVPQGGESQEITYQYTQAPAANKYLNKVLCA